MSCVQAVANSPLAMWHAGVEPNIGWITVNLIQDTRICTSDVYRIIEYKYKHNFYKQFLTWACLESTN